MKNLLLSLLVISTLSVSVNPALAQDNDWGWDTWSTWDNDWWETNEWGADDWGAFDTDYDWGIGDEDDDEWDEWYGDTDNDWGAFDDEDWGVFGDMGV
jgi:hypothetical protein